MFSGYDHIHIFRTNLHGHDEQLFEALRQHVAISQWSVDTADVDCVLRVVSAELQPEYIIGLLSLHGYHCEELE